MQMMFRALPHRRKVLCACTGVFMTALLCHSTRVAPAQAASTGSTQVAVTLSGIVVDASGKPIADAQVFADLRDGAKPVEARADASGHFVLHAMQIGSYTVHASILGTESERSVVRVTNIARQDLRIVLPVAGSSQDSTIASASASDGMSFTDAPSFVVAGVTDWTAVGGHGSDATLRTSEELNRETLALRARNAGFASPGAADADNEEKRLTASLSASPESYTANKELGLLYLRQSRFVQSVPYLQAAARLSGGQHEDEYNLASAFKSMGDYAAALLHVQRALSLKEDSSYHLLAGEIEEKLGNPLAAVRQEERATILQPREENYFAWGTELLVHRAIWQAADVFAKGASAYPGSVRMQTAWGAALFAGARYEEAAGKICAASDLDPSAREPYLFAGKIALASPSTIGCVADKLERFLTLRPDDPEANYLNAMLLLKKSRTAGSTARVQQMLLHAANVDPKCSDCFLQLGILSAAQKDYADAIAAYQKALGADPRSGEAHFRLGVAYDRTGNAEQAKAEYRLHDQIEAENAAVVEQQRRQVQQFTIEPNTSQVHPGAK